MFFALGHKAPSLPFRLTALFAAGLIGALSIFAASPILHAWLHSHETGTTVSSHRLADTSSANASSALPNDHTPDTPANDHDDGCAVALFAAGVLALCCALLGWFFLGRVRALRLWANVRLAIQRPRDWLPPLCGPPAN